MIWAFELLSSIFFGYEVLTFFVQCRFNFLHRLFAGIPIGFFSFAWIVFVISSKFQITTKLSVFPIALLTVAGAYMHHCNNKISGKKLYLIQIHALQLFVYIVFGIFYVYLIDKSMLSNDYRVRGAAYGDLPFHINIVTSFAYGTNNIRNGLYDINSSFYANEKLAYPIITNFFTGALMGTGKSTLRIALFLPSALIFLSLLIGIYSLSFYLTRSYLSAALSVFLFTNLGGLGWIRLFNPKHGYGDWAHNWGNKRFEYWFHPLFHVLIPQRASLYSMPLCYWSILILLIGIKDFDWKMFFAAGIFVGFTPLVQLHSYVALAQYAIVLCIITFPYRNKKIYFKAIKAWVIFGVVANVMAFPQLLLFLGRLNNNKEFCRFKSISKIRKVSFFKLWWNALGVFAVIALSLDLVLLNRKQIIAYIPSLFVFTTSNLIIYQPWELDNLKLFYAAWIPVALPIVSQYLVALTKQKYMLMISFLLIFASSLSSIIYSIDCLTSNPQLFDKWKEDLGYWIAENTPKKAVFLTSSDHNIPITTFGGRQTLLGYGGWLSSHGIKNYHERRNEVNKIMSNPNQTELIKKYNITYLVWESSKKTKLKEYDHRIWQCIYSNNRYAVMKKRKNELNLNFYPNKN